MPRSFWQQSVNTLRSGAARLRTERRVVGGRSWRSNAGGRRAEATRCGGRQQAVGTARSVHERVRLALLVAGRDQQLHGNCVDYVQAQVCGHDAAQVRLPSKDDAKLG